MSKRKYCKIAFSKEESEKEFSKFASIKKVSAENMSSSKLLMRRKKGCASNALSALSIGKEVSVLQLSTKQIIQEMRDNVSSISTNVSSKKCTSLNAIDYIFQRHNAVGKSVKEQAIAEFLDKEGIFKINLQICLEDFIFIN